MIYFSMTMVIEKRNPDVMKMTPGQINLMIFL